MRKSKVYIIGVAPEGVSSLSRATGRLITRAEIVFGGERLLQMFPHHAGEKLIIKNNLAEVACLIKTRLGLKRMVVLASGDPNFFGIAKYLIAKLGKEVVEIVPNVSAMQVAFARIKEGWDDAALVSVHSRPIEDIIDTVRSSSKIGIFTDDEHTPATVAKALLRSGVDNYQAYICQDLGTENEEVVETDLEGLCRRKFSPLNVLILLRAQQKNSVSARCRPLLGISDEDFYQRRPKEGLITKQEVRAISLSKMCLTEESVLWDIGAGSGAVSIEASYLARKGRVYAIEKNRESIAIIRENIHKFNRHNIKVVQASAPNKLDGLPDPMAVFIGGSGRNMISILDCICRRLKPHGRIVINIATFENLNHAISGLESNGLAADITLVNVARSKDIAKLTRFEALNPVFIITGKREGETKDT